MEGESEASGGGGNAGREGRNEAPWSGVGESGEEVNEEEDEEEVEVEEEEEEEVEGEDEEEVEEEEVLEWSHPEEAEGEAKPPDAKSKPNSPKGWQLAEVEGTNFLASSEKVIERALLWP